MLLWRPYRSHPAIVLCLLLVELLCAAGRLLLRAGMTLYHAAGRLRPFDPEDPLR